MKKITVAFLLAIALVSQAFAKSDEEYRSAFFMRATTGYTYVGFNRVLAENDLTQEWNGIGANIDLNLGFSIRRLFALYAGFEFTTSTGEWSRSASFAGKYIDQTYDANHVKFGVDFGAIFTPFRSVPVAKGILFGLGLGIGVTDVNVIDDDALGLALEGFTATFKLEAGYVWNVARKMSLGVVAFVKPMVINDDEYEDGDFSGSEIGIAFTIMKR